MLTHDDYKLNGYWKNLIWDRNRNLNVGTEDKEGYANLEQQIDNSKSNEEIFKIIKEAENKKGTFDFKIREKAIKRLGDFDLKEETEHGLKNFSPFLGANPRFMKRMINTFNILRTIAISSGFDVEILNKHLALWIIIELRWPILSNYLSEHPKSVSFIGTDIKENEVPTKQLQELFKNKEVINVVKGKDIGISLNENNIRYLANLRV